MSKQVIGFIIIALVFFFPFRWVFLEYPDTELINNTMIDSGRVEYVFYFLLSLIGFVAFVLINTEDRDAAKH